MNCEFKALLEELCSETPEHIQRRIRETYSSAVGTSRGCLVVFGAGQLGRYVLPQLQAAGLSVLAFCDNNAARWGTQVDGLAVLPPEEAIRRYADTAVFVIAIYNGTAVRCQLRQMGCRHVISYPLLFCEHSDYIRDDRLDLPHRVLQGAAEMPGAYELLADEESRLEFQSQIRWRCSLDDGCLPAPHPPDEMYFAPDLFSLLPDEVYVDGGAFDGDSIRAYLNRTESRFRQIVAFEPDAANLLRLHSYLSTLPPEVRACIAVMPYGLSRRDESVGFQADGTAGSKIVESGGSARIESRSLDSVLAGAACPTFIKMDIEGFEVEAIPGAARIAAECAPIMAVCAYHRPEHLWMLPKLLHAANPDYHIFLRRYAEQCWETVYYAVPPGRLIG
jgi:FkbM family methyltransferase